MPPRTRRLEVPARRDARIRKHIAQAREYWRKAPGYLAGGDLCQAGEKGWGAVSQLTKAMATLRGWQHNDHVAIRDAIVELPEEMPEHGVAIGRGIRAAESLHGNFYEVHMNAFLAQSALDDVRPLLEILWQQLPTEYTTGLSFAAFCTLEPEPEPPQQTTQPAG